MRNMRKLVESALMEYRQTMSEMRKVTEGEATPPVDRRGANQAGKTSAAVRRTKIWFSQGIVRSPGIKVGSSDRFRRLIEGRMKQLEPASEQVGIAGGVVGIREDVRAIEGNIGEEIGLADIFFCGQNAVELRQGIGDE